MARARRSPTRSPIASRILVGILVVLALHATATGCAKISLDLRNIEEPVMLNALPYSGSQWSAREVGEYKVQVSYATGGSHQPGINVDRASQILEDEAQLKTFEAIGGHSSRAVVVDELDVWGGGGNLLLVFMEMAAIDARGKVVELEPTPMGDDR